VSLPLKYKSTRSDPAVVIGALVKVMLRPIYPGSRNRLETKPTCWSKYRNSAASNRASHHGIGEEGSLAPASVSIVSVAMAFDGNVQDLLIFDVQKENWLS
jgi:hypothetical protein